MPVDAQTDLDQEYQWRLGRRSFTVRRSDQPLDKLEFDPRNQRIQYALRANNVDPMVADQDTIYEALLKVEGDHVNRLYWQIAEAGGLLEPLIVTPEGSVIEGNCRLAALRKLCNDYPSEGAFCSPPCEILPGEFDEEARLLYLGDCHVAGKQRWDAYEVAEHVYKMVTQLNKSHDFIAKTLRMSKSTVSRYLEAYEMHTEYLRAYPFPGNIYKWSYFLEFQKRKQLRDRRRDDADFEPRFVRWVEDGHLSRGDQVRQLPQLLDDEEALSLLDSVGFKAAWEHYQRNVARDSLDAFPDLERAIEQLENFSVRDMEILSHVDSQGAALIRKLHERILVVARLAHVDLDGVQNESSH